jgi:hypothetical protein
MKIDKNLVIDFKDILADENPDAPTYENQTFYMSNEKRLRWKLNDLDDEVFKNNKFYQCFNIDNLEILRPNEWDELSKMSFDEMSKLVNDNKWDWLGEDFVDMQDYLSFVETHDLNIFFTTNIDKNDEYMDIFLHDISMYNDKEKEIYKKGLIEGSARV